jgi:hypothetical protein
VQLVRAAAPNQTFVLTANTSGGGTSRYFDIEGREGTTPADVARLGRAIDEAFATSPFQKRRDDDRRLPTQPNTASKPYTIAVTFVLAAALAAGLLLLWGYTPPHPPGRFGA